MEIDTWEDFVNLHEGECSVGRCHWCGDGDCEKTKITIRNAPFGRDMSESSCVHCGQPSQGRVLIAQSY